MHWYVDVLKKYATFSGRARRKEYWMFTLINTVIYAALLALDFGLLGLGFIAPLYMVAVLVPTLAVLVRRLHDTGRSGWWFFISFVPLVGGIVLLVFTVSDSKPEANEYGFNPKAVPATV
ncbi:DUF805 domain-containing protein [Streptomyces sp. NPDC006610]|jgi:uncharacterized membrane protein YhaH (DUF805 family)|uniref:DUF805 domain-containing protein n=1 Tax=Streptomyces sp. NPDC006610 TaxID=3154584 RepID=UPI0033BFB028